MIKALGQVSAVHGLAHITGGGLVENPPRAYGKSLALDLDLSTWTLPPVFQWLKNAGGIEAGEMARVFNCGVGILLYVNPDDVEATLSAIQSTGHSAWVAGQLIDREENGDAVILNHLELWDQN